MDIYMIGIIVCRIVIIGNLVKSAYKVMNRYLNRHKLI